MALRLVEFSGPVTPEELARRVSIVLGHEITAQKLSKALPKRGVPGQEAEGKESLRL
jgi:hypothetical protein